MVDIVRQADRIASSAERGSKAAVAVADEVRGARGETQVAANNNRPPAGAVLENYSNKTNLLWFGDMALPMVAIPLGWAAKQLAGDKGKAWVHGILKTPIKTLHDTRLGDLGQLPANATKAFSEIANANGVPELAANALAKSERLAVSGAKVSNGINGVFAPANEMFKGAAARAASGNAAGGIVSRIADWRAASVDRAIARTAERLTAVNSSEALGTVGQIKRAVGMNVAAAPAPALSHAQPVMSAIHSGNATADSLRTAITSMQANLPKEMPADMSKRVQQVTALAEKAARQIETKSVWGEVSKGGMSAMIAGIPKALGRVPLFYAILATGIAAGGAALALRAKQDNSEAGVALKDMAADLYGVDAAQVTSEMIHGKNAPVLLQKAASKLGAQARGNWMSAGMHTAAEAVFLAPNASAMIANMALGTGADMLKAENPFVQAYAALKANDASAEKLSDIQRTPLVAMLVAASPAIEAHGGMRNKLVRPIAEQMVKEGLTAKQIALEVSNVSAIEKRAADTAKTPVAEITAVKVEHPIMLQAGAPAAGTKLQAGSIASQGRVVETARGASV